jgi:hypothetical protein
MQVKAVKINTIKKVKFYLKNTRNKRIKKLKNKKVQDSTISDLYNPPKVSVKINSAQKFKTKKVKLSKKAIN